MDDYSRIFDLSGRRAHVIGGASGIGRASCFGLSSFGARVICGDVEIAKAKEVALAMSADGRAAEALHIDLCDRASVAAAAKTDRRSGRAPHFAFDQRTQAAPRHEDEFDRVVGLRT